MERYLDDESGHDAARAEEMVLSFPEDDGSGEGEETGPPPDLTPDEVYFPREYASFVSRLAHAVHKHSMYPPAHPALRPTVLEVRQALEELMGDRYEVAMEVARNQVAIDGAESDPRNAQFRSLAGLLHRHQLAAVTFFVGAEEHELAEFLASVAREPERSGRPLGEAVSDEGLEWPNIRLHAIRYGALGISRGEVRERPSDPEAAAKVWLGLARAALSDGRAGPDRDAGEGDADFEPEALAAAVERRATEQEFATDLVGKLASLSRELRGGGQDEELRGRASRFVSLISPETLRRVLSVGGDGESRRTLVQSAADWMDPGSMVKLVRAAAGVERQDLSHTCLLLMMKLARYAGSDDPELGREAEARLRSQVDELVSEWTVGDAIPDRYGEALERMSSTAGARAEEPGRREPAVESERLLQMSIELERPGPRLAAAVTDLLGTGRFSALFESLDAAPEGNATAEAVWESLEGTRTVRRILDLPEPDFEALDRVLERIGVEAVPVMLEVLIESESRAVRRHLFVRIGQLGPGVGPHILRHLEDGRWYVRRNMLALLQTLHAWPPGWSPSEHARDPHPAVRREALKMLLGERGQRDRALRQLLEEDDPRSIALGIGAALEETPPELIPTLLGVVGDWGVSEELRAMAVRALARLRAPETVVALIDLVCERPGRLGRLLRRWKLRPAGAVMLEALNGLARHWWHDETVQRLLAAAEKADDPAVREAARGRRGET